MTTSTAAPGTDRARTWLLGLVTALAAASVLSIAVSQILLGCCLLLLLSGVRLGWWPWPRTGLELPLGLFTGWALLTIPFSTDIPASLAMTKRFFLYAPLWVGYAAARDERARAWLLGAFVTAAFVNAAWSLGVDVIAAGDFSGRNGLLQHSPMTGAWLMAVAATVAFAMALSAPSWRARVAGWTAVPVILAILLFTWTRSGWIGAAGGLTAVLALLRPRWLPALAVAGAVVLLAGPASVRERAATIFDPEFRTNAQRIEMWGIGSDLVREHPITGVGDRSLEDYSPTFHKWRGGRRIDVRLRHFHQNQVMMAVLWGLPGLGLGTWFLLAAGRRLWRLRLDRLRERGHWPSWADTWLVAGLGVWVVLNVVGLVDWSFGDAEMSLVFFLVLGLALGSAAGATPRSPAPAAGGGSARPSTPSRRRRRRPGPPLRASGRALR